MFTKFLCPKSTVCVIKSEIHHKSNLADYYKKLLNGEIFPRDDPVNLEEVCCTLSTRKIQDHPCRGPQNCYFEPTAIKLIIHGWLETRYILQYKHLVKQYLQKGNYNVIRVDWSKKSALGYINSVKRSVSIGKVVAEFLVRLLEARITTHKKIHIIGHSLGAHIAGIAGKEVASLTGEKVARITGLDPAKQLFEVPSCPPNVRLQSTDASMVDVTHTDCLMFGFKEPLGTVDFYVNGIGRQPAHARPRLVLLRNVKELEDYIFRSHRRSLKHFIESINSTDMVGWKCGTLNDIKNKICDIKKSVVYGENTPSTAEGLYFVRTACD